MKSIAGPKSFLKTRDLNLRPVPQLTEWVENASFLASMWHATMGHNMPEAGSSAGIMAQSGTTWHRDGATISNASRFSIGGRNSRSRPRELLHFLSAAQRLHQGYGREHPGILRRRQYVSLQISGAFGSLPFVARKTRATQSIRHDRSRQNMDFVVRPLPFEGIGGGDVPIKMVNL
jgi:hypothetical protein